MVRSMRSSLFQMFSCASLVLLSSCSSGGGGGGGGSTVTGQFVDSLVEGLQYSTASASGLTDANGAFTYRPGEDVTFMVGDIIIGTVSASAVASPVDVVESASDYSTDPTVKNIARFLQTIDTDGLSDNGIQISQATRDAAVGQTISDWESSLEVQAVAALLTANPFVGEAEAKLHGNKWLQASRAGEYTGTWEGGVTSVGEGTWALSIDNVGEVVLIASNLEGDDEGGAGTVEADGSFQAELFNANFNGSIDGSTIAGNWFGKESLAGQTGTFSGSLAVNPMAFLDVNILPFYSGLDEEIISGAVLDAAGLEEGEFSMELIGDNFGRYAVDLDVMLSGTSYDTSFYVTSMSASSIKFRGLSETGEGFVGELFQNGDASGTYYNLDGSPGGTFVGALGDS